MSEGIGFRIEDLADHTAQTWSNVLHGRASAGEYVEAGSEAALSLLALRYGAGKLLGAADRTEVVGAHLQPIDSLLAELGPKATAAKFGDVSTFGLTYLTDGSKIGQLAAHMGAQDPAGAAVKIFDAVDRGWVAPGTTQLWSDAAAGLERSAGTTPLDTAIRSLEPFRLARGFRDPELYALTELRSPALIDSLAERIGGTQTGFDNLRYALGRNWNAAGTSRIWQSTLANLKGVRDASLGSIS